MSEESYPVIKIIIFHEEKFNIIKHDQKSARFFKELTPNHHFEAKKNLK